MISDGSHCRRPFLCKQLAHINAQNFFVLADRAFDVHQDQNLPADVPLSMRRPIAFSSSSKAPELFSSQIHLEGVNPSGRELLLRHGQRRDTRTEFSNVASTKCREQAWPASTSAGLCEPSPGWSCRAFCWPCSSLYCILARA